MYRDCWLKHLVRTLLHCSLLITSSLIAHYSLLIAHYSSLLIAHYSLPVAHYPLFITHYSLPVAHYPLFITHCFEACRPMSAKELEKASQETRCGPLQHVPGRHVCNAVQFPRNAKRSQICAQTLKELLRKKRKKELLCVCTVSYVGAHGYGLVWGSRTRLLNT
jgi:hypothetical protein